MEKQRQVRLFDFPQQRVRPRLKDEWNRTNPETTLRRKQQGKKRSQKRQLRWNRAKERLRP